MKIYFSTKFLMKSKNFKIGKNENVFGMFTFPKNKNLYDS